MNYDRIYKSLIDKRRKTPLKDGYKEHHHIIPKSMGGSDDFDNMVYLTAREHFVAHLLLARIHGGKMWFAVAMMCGRRSSSAIKVKTIIAVDISSWCAFVINRREE